MRRINFNKSGLYNNSWVNRVGNDSFFRFAERICGYPFGAALLLFGVVSTVNYASEETSGVLTGVLFGISTFPLLAYATINLIGEARDNIAEARREAGVLDGVLYRSSTVSLPDVKPDFQRSLTNQDIEEAMVEVKNFLLQPQPAYLDAEAVLIDDLGEEPENAKRWINIFRASGDDSQLEVSIDAYGRRKGNIGFERLQRIGLIRQKVLQGNSYAVEELIEQYEGDSGYPLINKMIGPAREISKECDNQTRGEMVLERIDREFFISGKYGLSKADLLLAEHIVTVDNMFRRERILRDLVELEKGGDRRAQEILKDPNE